MRSYDDQSVLFQRAQVGTDTKLQRFVIALQWFIHENKRCVECQSAGKRYAFLRPNGSTIRLAGTVRRLNALAMPPAVSSAPGGSGE